MPPKNRLIVLLPRKDRLHFIDSCAPVQLLLGQVSCEPGNATRYAYFPVDSFISLLTQIDDKPALEVGLVGREGMLGAELGLGVATTPKYRKKNQPGASVGWRFAASWQEALRYSKACIVIYMCRCRN